MTDTSNASASDATIAALRATDKQGEEQVAAVAEALTPAPVLRNTPVFNHHTQALAGVLMAKEEEFKRVDMELADRVDAAEEAHRAAIAAADYAHRVATEAADQVRADTQRQINEESVDLTRARDGIRKTIAALS